MIIQYLNYTHILTLLATAALIAAFYFLLRNHSVLAKEIALYSLMGFNVTQHFFKFFFWPHMWGAGFGIENTAYNVCAILIIASPFVFVTKNTVLKQYMAYVGSIGPALALIIPYWFIGKTIFDWEFLRFWTCHALLVATSLLPALWGFVKFNFHDGWKFGLIFLVMQALILLNDTIFLLVLGYATKETLYTALLIQNPLMIIAPSEGARKFKIFFEILSPHFLLETKSHPYIPILWYAVPVYVYITAIAYMLGCSIDRRWLKSDKLPLKRHHACGQDCTVYKHDRIQGY